MESAGEWRRTGRLLWCSSTMAHTDEKGKVEVAAMVGVPCCMVTMHRPRLLLGHSIEQVAGDIVDRL